MGSDPRTFGQKIWRTFSSIKTGVVLLIVVVIVSAAGTVILQRPATEADEIQRAYAPQTLRLLDAIGLTDVFHAWWFVLLLVLVSFSIVAASIERFPNAWRFYSRPYKSPDESFRKALPLQKRIPIEQEEAGLVAAERGLHAIGLKPERVVAQAHMSIFAERHRMSEMAVYIVHASLLLIFFGGIVDALWGWRGFVNLTRGEQSNVVSLQNGSNKILPFAVRCDEAGQENYKDGTPRKWWSKLAVVKDGQDLQRKEIVVNDPLVYSGVRFYQSSYGPSGKLETLILDATSSKDPTHNMRISLAPDATVGLDQDTSVTLAEFIPDYVVREGRIYTRSTQVDQPAVHLVVASRSTGNKVNVWLPPVPGFEENENSPYQFEAQDLKMGYFTGLQVSHEPGQWAVWTGVLLMGVGLVFVFYVAHTRFWAVPVRDSRGKLELWVGGTANRNREAFAERFQQLVQKIESELEGGAQDMRASEHRTSIAAV